MKNLTWKKALAALDEEDSADSEEADVQDVLLAYKESKIDAGNQDRCGENNG